MSKEIELCIVGKRGSSELTNFRLEWKPEESDPKDVKIPLELGPTIEELADNTARRDDFVLSGCIGTSGPEQDKHGYFKDPVNSEQIEQFTRWYNILLNRHLVRTVTT